MIERGRCNIGQEYVCLDGPVFTYAQITQLLEELWLRQLPDPRLS